MSPTVANAAHRQPRRKGSPRPGQVILAAAVLVSGLVTTGAASAAPATTAACPTTVAGGATVPFTEYEAECAATNGAAIGPDLTQGSLPAEASGRQAVQLSAQGQYVEFSPSKAANSINVRYSVPDGRSGTLAIYVNGGKLDRALPVTSKYSYLDTPWIQGSKTHKLYDESRLLLGRTVNPGDKVRLQVDAGNTATPYTIDLAGFEQVGPAGTAPAGALPVTAHGATPDDGSDDSAAFRAAIAAAKAQAKEVWVPPGTFEIGSALQVDQVTIRGAGQWYSVLHGNNVFNNNSATGNIGLHDFAVFGEVTERNDGSPDNAFHGVLGAGSVVSGLWIQHTKCGLWLMNGATSGLTIENNRIIDTTADGINFDGNVKNSAIRNNFLRNNGDDAIALWSNGVSDSGDTIANNTVVQPNLANGIALYGGSDNTVTGNLVRDTNPLGGGITVANRFNSTPLSGTITVSDNITLRAGALDPNWQFGVGALWFDARDQAISGATIRVTNLRTIENPYEALQFLDGNGQGKPIQGVTIDGVSVERTGTFVAQAQTQGTVSISNLTATGVGVVGTYNCPYPANTPKMTFTGSGNTGWTGTWTDCSTWPPPNSGPPVPPGPGSNVAKGKPITASGSQGGFPPGNANDGDTGTYWESTNNALPQTLTVDLGEATGIDKVTLKLPPSPAWGARTQTLSVQGSGNGTDYGTIVASRGHTFDPATGNTATITFPATTQRFVRLAITANTGWPAGQVAELEVTRT
ncbi:discoidin domain-containing protein [Amycolatopsis nigrescens]|uniref:discoidin domain-containing protein n=1 Tax=Amycolatopsis nigrescens TaxID=381445 RepID=UPI000A02D531|nr:discoidin domain-containing protein [Amycolatopsis nigrescens]